MTQDSIPAPAELEIKFLLPPGAEAALAAHLASSGGCPEGAEVRRELTTYFDTPDRDLARRGASLRVRDTGNGRVQTLKVRGNGMNAFARGEWEWPQDGNVPDPEKLAATPLASLLGDLGQLGPVFTTDISRTIRMLRPNGTLIEAAIDLGSIRAGDVAEEIRELELELKGGKVAELYQFAATLRAELPLLLGTESKADRGWRLSTGRPRSPEKAADIPLRPDVTAAEAIRRCLGMTLANLLANQPAAAAGVMEGVHNMRIAIRRLRAVLALFKPHLSRVAEARFTDGLRHLGRVLGEARDWDVFCTEALAAAAADGVAVALLNDLHGPAEAERSAAHDRLSAALSRPALTTLVLELAAWAEDPAALAGSPDAGRMHAPVASLAPALQERLERKVLRRGRHIRRRDEEELHDLRKAVKKLRYGIEFLAPLHRHKQVKAYLHACKALQEQLGIMNDATVAVGLARRLAAGREAELTPSVAALTEWEEGQRTAARHHLPAAWGAFKAAALPEAGGGRAVD